MLDVTVNERTFKLGKLEKWWVALDDPQYFPAGRKELGSGWFWRQVKEEDNELKMLQNLINEVAPKVQLLVEQNEELKEALEAFCKFHEHNASWDKTGSVYYNAKKVLNRVNNVEEGIR